MILRHAFRRATPVDRRLALVLAGGALSAGALAPWAPLLARFAPACVFHAWTGLPCPACGTTRAALALARLDVAAALAWNPLATLALGGGFVGALLAAPWIAAGGPVPRLAAVDGSPWLRAGALAALVAQWAWLVARGV